VTAPKVFLSYAHVDADKKFVRGLHQRLRRDGIECFFDEVSLAPGANFVLEISQAIDECNYLVMAMSADYFSARFAPREWAAVVANDAANERGRLVPLLLERCELPALLRALNYIDVSSAEKFEQNYFRIRQRVGRLEPNDIEQRSREIEDLYEQRRVEQMMKRLLDFARDFAKREILHRLIGIKWQLERIENESDISKRAFASIDLVILALNLKDAIITELSLDGGR
jgi:TIR domain-containing protein